MLEANEWTNERAPRANEQAATGAEKKRINWEINQ